MHIDVNNAFLSWTAIDLLNHGYKKDIRNIEAVIGGDEEARHGIVLAKSTPAKKLGIVTAETLYQARKKCPKLEIYPPNYPYYVEMSRKLFSLISKYTPDIEVFSIDECFLEYTHVKNLYGDPIKFAYKLKDEIYNTLGFTVNIGIGENKLCAKMASDFEKPNKVHTLFKDEIETKMWPLDVGELLWIGKKSKERLYTLGIRSIGALAKADYTNLYYYFKNQTKQMIEHANGIDNDPVIVEREEAKGISMTRTIDHDVNNRLELYDYLNWISNDLAIALRKQDKYTKTIAVILKDTYFKQKTHQRKLPNPTNSTAKIYQVSKELLDETWNGESIRLIGIRLDNLSEKSTYQISLFEDIENHEKDTKLDSVMDSLKTKYGSKIINKASLLPKKKKM